MNVRAQVGQTNLVRPEGEDHAGPLRPEPFGKELADVRVALAQVDELLQRGLDLGLQLEVHVLDILWEEEENITCFRNSIIGRLLDYGYEVFNLPNSLSCDETRNETSSNFEL